MYLDRRSDYRFIHPNFNTLSLGLGKPDCVRIRLGLLLEVVLRSIRRVHDIMKYHEMLDVMKS